MARTKKRSSMNEISKKRTEKKTTKRTDKKPIKKVRRKPVAAVMKTTRRITDTTKRAIDDVLLKVVGMRVLARAEEMAKALRDERRKKVKRKKAQRT